MGRRTSFQSLAGLEGDGDVDIRPSSKPNHALITIGAKRAVEYDLEEKQIVKSFFVPSHMALSTPLCYDPLTRQMVCCLNKTSLLVWDGQENHLDKIQQTRKLEASVSDILATDGTLILVFQNGDLQPLQYIVEPFSNAVKHQAVKSRSGKDIKVSMTWSKDGAPYRIKRGSQGVDLSQAFVDSHTGGFSQQHLKFIPVKENFDVSGLTLIRVASNEKYLMLRDLLASTSTDSYIAMDADMLVQRVVPFDDTHVVVHCVPTRNEEGLFFQLIDIMHGTVINTLQVKSLTSLEFRCFKGSKVLFKQGLKVSCWQLHSIPQTLSELTGTKFEALAVSPKGDLEWESLDADNDKPALESTLAVLRSNDLDKSLDLLGSGSLTSALTIALFERIILSSDDPDEEQLYKALCQLQLPGKEMTQYLRRMDFRAAKALIAKILALIGKVNQSDDVFETLLSWLELLLDAQYANFIVSKDDFTIRLLGQCSEILSGIDASINLLATTLPHIEMLQKKMVLDKNSSINREYAVETVYL